MKPPILLTLVPERDESKVERVPCYRDDDCAMHACIRCGGTGWVKQPQPMSDAIGA